MPNIHVRVHVKQLNERKAKRVTNKDIADITMS